jgi:DEAD/DEAH box helicase domain-containing protein
MSEAYPAEEISLRSASPQNFVILDSTDKNRVIGEVDYFSAPYLIYKDAIYMHGADQYQIQELDWEGKKAYAKEVDVDYFTDAETKTDIKVLQVFGREENPESSIAHGEVSVTSLTTLFKKIKLQTHENVGWGKIQLPPQEMHTTSFWFEFLEDIRFKLNMTSDDLAGSLRALANVLRNIVPIWVMCDPKDIRSFAQVKSPFTERPTIYIYDNYPGGVGFSKKIFTICDDLWLACKELITKCECPDGCPSCVGPRLEVGDKGKKNCVKLIDSIL